MSPRAIAAGAALFVVAAPLFGTLAGCGEVQHIRPHTPRHREYEPGPYEESPHAVSEGSLWDEGSRGLFADFRAAGIGDLVTVRIDENPRAIGDAQTQMARDSEISAGVRGFFGLTTALAQAYPAFDPSQLLGLMAGSSFEGGGTTGRSSQLRASVAVRVRRVLPNGDLFVEGTKVLLVNDEELHIYLSGVIRPQDIEQDNSIASGQIADAQIEFTGRGDLTQQQRQGWLQRILTDLMPF